MNYEETRRTLTARPNVQAIRNAMRFRNNMNRAELARRSGLSKGTVTNILNRKRDTFNTETANSIADALGVSAEDLFMLESLTVKVTRRTAA